MSADYRRPVWSIPPYVTLHSRIDVDDIARSVGFLEQAGLLVALMVRYSPANVWAAVREYAIDQNHDGRELPDFIDRFAL